MKIKFLQLNFVIGIFIWCWLAHADLIKNEQTIFHFLSKEDAAIFLSTPDAYTDQLSSLDLSLYHGTSRSIGKQEHLDFLQTTTLDWTDAEKRKIESMLASYFQVIATTGIKILLPTDVLFVKTNGKDTFNAHYTRGNAIVFPALGGEEIKTDLGTFYHEMFHIFSRHNSHLQDELYGICNFKPIAKLEFLDPLRSIQTTNPDAFIYQHALTLEKDGVSFEAIAFMYSAISQIDINGPVNEASVYRLGMLDIATMNTSSPKMYKTNETNFKDVVMANSHYYIHPEEIMAENFRLLFLSQTQDWPKPAIKYPKAVNQLLFYLKGL